MRKRVLFFFSSAPVFNDKVIPVILELANQGCDVTTFFLNEKSYNQLSTMTPYYNWISNLTKVVKLAATRGPRSYRKFIKGYIYAKIVYAVLFKKGYVAFFDTKKATLLEWILARIAYFNGTVVQYSGVYLPYYSDEFEKNYAHALTGNVSRALLQKKAIGQIRKKRLKPFHFKLQYGNTREKTGPKTLTVPFPKLQPWWGSFIKKRFLEIDDPRLAGNEKFVSVFLTHYGNYFFEDGFDLDDFLRDILSSVREQFGNILIVIKPKYSLDKKRLSLFLENNSSNNVVVTDTPVFFLAGKSLCGISVCHSSAQFEFQVGEAPWIEYCSYSNFWKTLCPEITYTTKYGGLYAETYKELGDALKSINRFYFDLNKYKKDIGYYDQEISIDFFKKQSSL